MREGLWRGGGLVDAGVRDLAIPVALAWCGAGAFDGVGVAVDAAEVYVLEAGEGEAEEGAAEDEDCGC